MVEDYRASGLSLRAHPLAFLRDELRARKMISCEELQSVKDGRWIDLAGVVLVRQKPGSAKGVMFITLEDETNVANLVVWTKVFEANRRIILSASIIAARGMIQREGEVVHFVVHRLSDLSDALASVGGTGPPAPSKPSANSTSLPPAIVKSPGETLKKMLSEHCTRTRACVVISFGTGTVALPVFGRPAATVTGSAGSPRP